MALGRSLNFPSLGLWGQREELFHRLVVHTKLFPREGLLLTLSITIFEDQAPEIRPPVLGLSRPPLHREEYRHSLKSHTQTHLLALPLQVHVFPANHFIRVELTRDKWRVRKDHG